MLYLFVHFAVSTTITINSVVHHHLLIQLHLWRQFHPNSIPFGQLWYTQFTRPFLLNAKGRQHQTTSGPGWQAIQCRSTNWRKHMDSSQNKVDVIVIVFVIVIVLILYKMVCSHYILEYVVAMETLQSFLLVKQL